MSFLTGVRPILPPLSSSFRLTTTLRTFTTSPASKSARMSIIGRLADTPELVPTSTGNDLIKYSLATSSGPKDRKQTSWWKVTCFPGDKVGLKDFMRGFGKGTLIHVEGDCKMDKFKDSEGKDRSALSIVQKTIEILDRRENEQEQGEGTQTEEYVGRGY